jgi:predicted NUDIX family NTP pyrophosphohydrolase
MPKLSAGLVVVRVVDGGPQFLLVHPGGPFWRKKDDGAWSIPKGEYSIGEDPEEVALREFTEELGSACPAGPRYPLGSIKQPSGKVVSAWCLVADVDVDGAVSNTFELEWPPRSGRIQVFPEVDRAEYFSSADAESKILAGQRPLLQKALDVLAEAGVL